MGVPFTHKTLPIYLAPGAWRLASVLVPGKYAWPIFRDRDRVLEVRRQRAVRGHDRPPVAQRLRRRPADVHHRLDRERQPRDELLAALGLSIVRNLRLLVELHTD